MDGRRTALIVASDEYDHPGLRQLRAPAADARALAAVLGDAEIGGFDVRIVHNAPAYEVEGQIEDVFADSRPDDLVLLHFSCHGLKSDAGELFFAARNTRPDRLGSTAVAADFIQRCMRTARARSIVLFLDCCYGGAFGEGVAVRASGSANVLDSFPAGRLGGGRGRAVITASSAMEYAFEGNSLSEHHQQEPSLFTAALVEGLSSGAADGDEDGLISLNELYDYVFDQVRAKNPKQTPGRDVEMEGELYLARSHRKRVRAIPIPPDVQAALKDPNMFTRLGAVGELRARLLSADPGAALGAHEALVEVTRTDIRYVADAAGEALAAVPKPEPPAPTPEPPAPKPEAAAPKPEAAAPKPEATAPKPEATAPKPEAAAPTSAAPTETAPTETAPTAPTAPASSEPSPTPAQVARTTQPATSTAHRSRLDLAAGLGCLVSGGLMVLGTFLSYQDGTALNEMDADLARWVFVLSVLALATGVAALALRTRPLVGHGLAIGLAASGLWAVVAVVVDRDQRGGTGFGLGWWSELAAVLLLVAAGMAAAAAARQRGELSLRAPARRDWIGWAAVALGLAGAVPLLVLVPDAWSTHRGLGANTVVLAVLVVAAPLFAVLLRPVVLGRFVLAGWAAGALDAAVLFWIGVWNASGESRGMPFVALTLVAMFPLAAVLHRRAQTRRAPVPPR